MKPRKPIGVWMLLQGGEPWMYSREANIDEAMKTARALAGTYGDVPLLHPSRVWLAPPAQVGRKARRARYRKENDR